MALPTTGSLSIKIAAGTTRSIACEVDGNVTGDKSLSTLSTTAGKGAPHCMLEFYGYANAPTICMCIDTSSTSVQCNTTSCYIAYTPIRRNNQCSTTVIRTCVDYNGCQITGSGCLSVYWNCNAGAWNLVDTVSGTGVFMSGSFTISSMDYNDSICVRMVQYNTAGTGSVSICLHDPPGSVVCGDPAQFARVAPTIWTHGIN